MSATPLGATPVSATSAAGGGATGLDEETPKQPSVFRRHPLATGIAVGAIAVVLISGLTAWGVGAAVTASLTSSTTSEMPMGTSTTAPPAGGTGKATTGRLAFRATIQSMSSESWTILTKKGKTVTVTVDSSTQFGTKKLAETATSFAVGDSVIIVAARGADGNPTATRVVDASALGTGAGAGADAGTGAGTGAGSGGGTTPMPSMSSTPTA